MHNKLLVHRLKKDTKMGDGQGRNWTRHNVEII